MFRSPNGYSLAAMESSQIVDNLGKEGAGSRGMGYRSPFPWRKHL